MTMDIITTTTTDTTPIMIIEEKDKTINDFIIPEICLFCFPCLNKYTTIQIKWGMNPPYSL